MFTKETFNMLREGYQSMVESVALQGNYARRSRHACDRKPVGDGKRKVRRSMRKTSQRANRG